MFTMKHLKQLTQKTFLILIILKIYLNLTYVLQLKLLMTTVINNVPLGYVNWLLKSLSNY